MLLGSFSDHTKVNQLFSWWVSPYGRSLSHSLVNIPQLSFPFLFLIQTQPKSNHLGLQRGWCCLKRTQTAVFTLTHVTSADTPAGLQRDCFDRQWRLPALNPRATESAGIAVFNKGKCSRNLDLPKCPFVLIRQFLQDALWHLSQGEAGVHDRLCLTWWQTYSTISVKIIEEKSLHQFILYWVFIHILIYSFLHQNYVF